MDIQIHISALGSYLKSIHFRFMTSNRAWMKICASLAHICGNNVHVQKAQRKLKTKKCEHSKNKYRFFHYAKVLLSDLLMIFFIPFAHFCWRKILNCEKVKKRRSFVCIRIFYVAIQILWIACYQRWILWKSYLKSGFPFTNNVGFNQWLTPSYPVELFSIYHIKKKFIKSQ